MDGRELCAPNLVPSPLAVITEVHWAPRKLALRHRCLFPSAGVVVPFRRGTYGERLNESVRQMIVWPRQEAGLATGQRERTRVDMHA